MHQVICAFSGTGKTHAAQQQPDLLIDYQLTSDDPIGHIRHLMSLGKVILLPTDISVMNRLGEEGIDFAILYPDLSIREECIRRHVARGDSPDHIQWLTSCWNDLYYACDDRTDGKKYVIKQHGYTVTDFLSDIGIIE